MDPETFEECEAVAHKHGLVAAWIVCDETRCLVVSSEEPGYEHATAGHFEPVEVEPETFLEATEMLCQVWFQQLDKLTRKRRKGLIP
jgi:hypothetical protein